MRNNVFELKTITQETREQALERLFKAHCSALRGFLSVRLGIREELDDIVQDVFARLARMDDLLEKMSPENQSARSFIFSVANRLVIDNERRNVNWRKYRKQQTVSANTEERSLISSPEEILLAREDLSIVKEVLARIKPEWARAFVLNRFKYKSYLEISKEMEISIRTVEKYICKTLFMIREALAKSKGITQ